MVATQTFFKLKPWGFMESQFDGCIFLDMGGSKNHQLVFKRPWPSLLRQERDLVLLDVRDVAEHLGYFFGGCEALPRLEGSSFNQEKNILQETSWGLQSDGKRNGGGITGFDGRNLLNHLIVEGVMGFMSHKQMVLLTQFFWTLRVTIHSQKTHAEPWTWWFSNRTCNGDWVDEDLFPPKPWCELLWFQRWEHYWIVSWFCWTSEAKVYSESAFQYIHLSLTEKIFRRLSRLTPKHFDPVPVFWANKKLQP